MKIIAFQREKAHTQKVALIDNGDAVEFVH